MPRVLGMLPFDSHNVFRFLFCISLFLTCSLYHEAFSFDCGLFSIWKHHSTSFTLGKHFVVPPKSWSCTTHVRVATFIPQLKKRSIPSLMLCGTFMNFPFFMHFGGGFFHQHFSCQATSKIISIRFQYDSLKLVLQNPR